MLDVTTKQVVFIDESIFKQQTGWRLIACAPIGQPARYSDDMTQGDTWSIRKGFFNGDTFVSWVLNELLPHLNLFLGP
jgi:hypothetical protein